MCYACIWMVNLSNRKVKKIVPEHEAIHPYFFIYKNQEYIAYLEENKIMLAEPPDKEYSKVEKDLSFKNYLALFDKKNTTIPYEFAKIYLSEIPELFEYDNLSEEELEMSATVYDLTTDKILFQNKNCIAVQCTYSMYEPGHSDIKTYFISYRPFGKIIETFKLEESISGDYLSTVISAEFMNDTVFKQIDVEYNSDVIYPEEEGGEPEFVTQTDTIGIGIFKITSLGRIEEYSEPDIKQ